MLLNKSDALLLCKVLFHYEKLTRYERDSVEDEDDLLELMDRIEDFLTDGEASLGSDEHVDVGGDVNSVLPSSEEEEDDDDEEVVTPPEANDKISASVLHDLPVVEVDANDKILSLEFEDVEGGVDILLEDVAIEDISLLRRTGKTLEIWAENDNEDFWHEIFDIKKLPKVWKLTLKDGVVYEVV